MNCVLLWMSLSLNLIISAYMLVSCNTWIGVSEMVKDAMKVAEKCKFEILLGVSVD